MLTKYVRRIYGLSILFLLILNANNDALSQTIDRIEIQDNLISSSFVLKTNYRPFISVNNSFSILINDGFTNRLQFIKLDTSNRVVKTMSYNTSQLLVPIVIQSATYYQGDIYFITKEQNGYIGKLDTDLNLVWLKRVTNANTSRKIYFQKSIVGLNNRIYIGGSSDSCSVISRYTPNGDFIEALEIRDHSAADSSFTYNGGTFQNLITDDTSLYLISNQNNSAYGSNFPSPVTILKLNPFFYYPVSITFFRTGGYQDEIVDFGLIERDQNLKIEFQNNAGYGGGKQYFSVKLDRNLTILDHQCWDVQIQNNYYASDKMVRLKGGNDFYDVTPISGFGQSGVFINRSYLGWLKQSSFYTPFSNSFPNSEIVGFTRHSRKYNFISKSLVYGNNGKTTLDIMSTAFPPSSLPCSNTNSSQINTYQRYMLHELFPKLSDRSIQIQLESLNIPGRPIAANQYPYCGYTQLDTCSVISTRIQVMEDTLCTGVSTNLTGLSYLGRNLSWEVDGQFYSNNKNISLDFQSPGNYWVKLTVDNGPGSYCTANDSIQIHVVPSPELINTDTIICKGDTIQLESRFADEVIWSSNANIECDTCSNTIVNTRSNSFINWTGSNQGICTVNSGFWLRTFPKATGTLTAPSVVCPGMNNSKIYLETISSHQTNWWLNGLGQIAFQNNDSAVINWSDSTGFSTLFIAFQDSNSCIGDTLSLTIELSTDLETEIRIENTSLCDLSKDSIAYQIDFPFEQSKYVWSAFQGQILKQDSSFETLINWDTIGGPKLIAEEFVRTNSSSCYGIDTLDISIFPNPQNNLNPQGPLETCAMEPVLFTSSPGWAGSSYWWQPLENSSNRVPGTAYNVSWTDSGVYGIQIYEESTKGCRGSYDTIFIRVNPKPETELLVDDITLCYSKMYDQTYEIIGFQNSEYFWEVKGGRITEESDNSFKVDWFPRGNKLITVAETSEFGCKGDTIFFPLKYDFSHPRILTVERLPFDTLITVKYDLEYHWTNPNDLLNLTRGNKYFNPKLDTIGFLFPHLDTYFDRNANPDSASVSYGVTTKNSCKEVLSSDIHSTIFLESEIDFRDNKENLSLYWNTYEGWEFGVQQYNVYEVLDSGLYFNTYSGTNRIIVEPNLNRKRHCFIVEATDFSGEYETWSNVACIEKEGLINIPNVVTNNGDGYNDHLEIFNLKSYSIYDLRIYNRSGKLIFKSSSYSNDWPKTETSAGTYFVSLKLQDDSGEEQFFKNWLQVLK